MTETWKQWEGQVVDDQFCLLRYLGGSDDSGVFLTNYGDPEPRNAAIKFVPEDPASAAFQLSRWELAATLSHPHLIRLFDFGRCRLDNIGLLYVVMEYAEENLSHVLPHRPLTGAEAYEMLDAVLDVLAYLHRKGFAHSHLKPANIMGVGDQLKISTDGVNLSKSERGPVILGVYDPPELATRGASPAADVWSLGATLVEALTQGLPSLKETREDPGLPDTVPAPFLEIARHCLRRDPERRWTVAEITARLQQIAPAAQEQLSASPPPAFAKHRYIVPAAAVGLALAAMVAGPRLFNPHQSVRRASSIPFDQPRAQQQGERTPAKPEAGNSTKRTSHEEQGLSSASPATSPFRSEAEPTTSPGRPAPGEVVKQVLPDVPTKARGSIQGRVKVSVRIRVDPSGSVVDAKLDSAGPSRYFANLALQAARRWRFRPAEIDARDVFNEWILRFEFLRNSTEVRAVRAGS
jgi:TonB family protein